MFTNDTLRMMLYKFLLSTSCKLHERAYVDNMQKIPHINLQIVPYLILSFCFDLDAFLLCECSSPECKAPVGSA